MNSSMLPESLVGRIQELLRGQRLSPESFYNEIKDLWNFCGQEWPTPLGGQRGRVDNFGRLRQIPSLWSLGSSTNSSRSTDTVDRINREIASLPQGTTERPSSQDGQAGRSSMSGSTSTLERINYHITSRSQSRRGSTHSPTARRKFGITNQGYQRLSSAEQTAFSTLYTRFSGHCNTCYRSHYCLCPPLRGPHVLMRPKILDRSYIWCIEGAAGY